MGIATKKDELIKVISAIEKEEIIEKLLSTVSDIRQLLRYVNSMRKKTDLTEIAKEQNYQPDLEVLENLGGAWEDMDENVEELLQAIGK